MTSNAYIIKTELNKGDNDKLMINYHHYHPFLQLIIPLKLVNTVLESVYND